jgi:hypothetical protein
MTQDLDENPTWRHRHWDSSVRSGIVRGADVTLATSVEAPVGLCQGVNLIEHEISIHYWLGVYDKQDESSVSSELTFRAEHEALKDTLRSDLTLGGYADGGLVPEQMFYTSFDIEIKGGMPCHHAEIRFRCRERAIQR